MRKPEYRSEPCLSHVEGFDADKDCLQILYARFKQPKAVSTVEGKTKWYAGWAYVGSGNLSESAW